MGTTPLETLDPCISGFGIVCGLEVHVNDDCSIEVQAGTAITAGGQLVHLEKIKKFHHYLLPLQNPNQRTQYLQQQLKVRTCYELSEATFDRKTMDSLKQQFQNDLPERAFLHNKILLLLVETNPNDDALQLSFWIVSLDELAKGLGIQSTPTIGSGLFGKVPTRTQVDPLEVDKHLRPVLNLPSMVVPRFGYKTLAIKEKAKGFSGEMVNPFSEIKKFQAIFSEYKAILDDLIPDFRELLTILHTNYSGLFTHKGTDYLTKFPLLLEAKWARFCKKGEHLYYIQYFYDWLRDLVKAYEELRFALTDVHLHCICEETASKSPSILLLGPVLGGRSSHQPLVFRDGFTAPFGQTNRESQLQHIKCLHWRLMMMIWTFDLPFLHLDEVLLDFGFDPGNEEKFDSTDFWESIGSINGLPLGFTPSKASFGKLGEQAIPYYYPLDGDSSYSVHRYWDPYFTKVQRSAELRSYNAHLGDATLPSTSPANDGYSDLVQTLYPLYFDLQEYPYLKVEGHIGKMIEIPGASTSLPEIKANNLCLDLIALAVDRIPDGLSGLEHQTALQPGQTLVLLYVPADEIIQDLEECKTDPVIPAMTIVADFVLPYRYTCCTDSDIASGVTFTSSAKVASSLETSSPKARKQSKPKPKH